MSENKKYYYMKLKENFFSSERMVVLEMMPDGILSQIASASWTPAQ